MRSDVGERSLRVVILVTVLGLVVVAGIAWQLLPLWRGDHELWVYSHDGRLVMAPSVRILASPGQPAAFASSGTPFIEIPPHLTTEGREILASGPGCGLLRAEFRGEHRLDLPPPIRAKIRVPGRFELPSGEHGIDLSFFAQGVSPDVASVLLCAPAASTFWDGPEPFFPSNHVRLDPATRTASVLLPCTGVWRVVWTHALHPGSEEGERSTFGILCGTGESILTIASDGEEHALVIDPEDLDTTGFGDD
jgi:hypothetical protein